MLRTFTSYSCWLFVLMAAPLIAGCRDWQQTAPTGKTLLKPIDVADDGMKLEIITVHCPLGDQLLNQAIWKDIDEQQFPIESRKQFSAGGLRAGILSGQLPAEISQLITAAEQQPKKISELAARLQTEPAVSRRQLQLYSGWHGEIVASGIYSSLPLLVQDATGVSGRTYSQAQGIFTAEAQALGERRVKLKLTPEIQYGEPRQQWVSDDGMLRPQSGKPKRIFEPMAVEASLAPGQMLILTCRADRPGTLGHYFFTEPLASSGGEDPQMQQKLLIVRVADTHYSDLFAPIDDCRRSTGRFSGAQ